MTDDLALDEFQELQVWGGSRRGAGVRAIQSGVYAEDFAANGFTVEEGPDGPYYTLSDWSREPLFWRLVYAVYTSTVSAEEPTSTRKSMRGRGLGKVSVMEANKAAAIYVANAAEFDVREDGGAYAVHKLYSEDREAAPLLLKRPMVGHLITAIRAGWLPWDANQGQLRISDEFRTNAGSFRIPRGKPRS